MSSRALKRLKGKNGIPALGDILKDGDVGNDDSSGDEKKQFAGKSVGRNAFTLLSEDCGNDVCGISKEDEDESQEEVVNNRPENKRQGISQIESDNKKGTKKKSKKQKKKNKEKSSSKNNPQDVEDLEDEDEIEKGIREVNDLLGYLPVKSEVSSSSSTELKLDTHSTLCVDLRNLNAENELRKKFGRYVVSGERRRNNHRRVTHRSYWLISPRPEWHPVGRSGISMTCEGKRRNCNYFFFEHSSHYQKIQFQFFDAVESLDHNNIVALLNAHRYHVDSLLQLSEICKMSEDYQTAAELIEKALHVFECGFHPLFNVTQGNCRLEYKRKENRAFFLALFRHVHYVANRACYLTALEFCKLILSLSPDDDPLGMTLAIDFYALKAEQYQFLINFYHDRLGHESGVIELLPNFAFSLPLALFYMDQKNTTEADNKLQKALLMFPGMLLPLMDKCGVTLDGSISDHSFFDRVKQVKQPVGLNALSQLFISRNHSLWKEPEVLNWLTTNCKTLIAKIDADSSLALQHENMRTSSDFYKYVHRPVDRHIILSEFKEAIAYLPAHIKNQSMMTFDPLPPTDSVCGYTRPDRSTNSDDVGILGVFLRSLLPSFSADSNARNAAAPHGNHSTGRQPQGAEASVEQHALSSLEQGARGVMGALRQLLDTMTYRGDLDENRQRRESDEDEWDDEPGDDHAPHEFPPPFY